MVRIDHLVQVSEEIHLRDIILKNKEMVFDVEYIYVLQFKKDGMKKFLSDGILYVEFMREKTKEEIFKEIEKEKEISRKKWIVDKDGWHGYAPGYEKKK